MSSRNRRTHLRAKTRTRDPMQDYDRLPSDLRAWLSQAALPWRPASVQKLYARALAQTGDRALAWQRLEAAERRLVSKDAAVIWGAEHPAARDVEIDVAEHGMRG